MKFIAHRGSCKHGGIENTYSSFKKAVTIKADRIELDLRLTKDNKAVVMHDPDTRRVYPKYKKKIKDSTLKELNQLLLSNKERIPEFSRVVDLVLKDIEINIELKGNDPRLVDVTYDILKQYQHKHPRINIYKKIIVSSFNSHLLQRMKKLDKNIKLAYLFYKPKKLEDLILKIEKVTKPLGIKILHPSMFLVNKNFVSWAKKQGYAINSYSGFKEEDNVKQRIKIWTILKECNIDGHCTNYVEEFRDFIKGKNKDKNKNKNKKR